MRQDKKFSYSKLFLRSLMFIAATGCGSAYALGPQVFTGINYSNPAALNMVKKAEVIVGGTDIAAQMQFTGSYLGVNSSTTSSTNSILPYGRFAYRLYPNIVVGVDVTQPIFTAVAYPSNSFISAATVSTYLRDTDISPRISWQVNQKLALGFGLNLNNLYNGQLNFAVPPTGTYYNKASSWAYGFNAGLSYVVREGTYTGMSYFSKIVQHLQGTSSLGTLASNNLKFNYIIVPATIRADLVQFLSPNWLINAIISYSVWNPVRFTVLTNTATGAPIVIAQHYYDNFDYTLATKYDFNTKWAGLALLEYNPGFQPAAYNNPGLPSGTNAIIAGIGAQYAIVKELHAKLVYAHVFGKSDNDLGGATPLSGHTNLSVNVVDFSLTYDI